MKVEGIRIEDAESSILMAKLSELCGVPLIHLQVLWELSWDTERINIKERMRNLINEINEA